MNDTIVKKAAQLFNEDRFHCSQAVFAAFADTLGISEEQALKIGACFGAGLNEGEVCGCVTGALMAIGLKCGQSTVDDLESRQKERELGMKLYERFKKEHGSCICRDLLKYDWSKPEDMKKLVETKLYLDICPKLVESATKIAADIIFPDAL